MYWFLSCSRGFTFSFLHTCYILWFNIIIVFFNLPYGFFCFYKGYLFLNMYYHKNFFFNPFWDTFFSSSHATTCISSKSIFVAVGASSSLSYHVSSCVATWVFASSIEDSGVSSFFLPYNLRFWYSHKCRPLVHSP